MGRKHGAVEAIQGDQPRRLHRMGLVVERPAQREQLVSDGPVGQAGVEMWQVVIVGETAGERALAGACGAVDGDDEGRCHDWHEADWTARRKGNDVPFPARRWGRPPPRARRGGT